MMLPLPPPAMIEHCAQTPAEPDGSRTLGVVPPYRGEPVPPAWLRAASHHLVSSHCRHYVYEAYADGGGGWLVRYQQLPEAGERVLECQQAFLFGSDPLAAPGVLRASEIQFESMNAEWQGRGFTLVDRRDLIR